jgi:hypothetical protein
MIAHPPQYPIFYNGIKDIITHGADGWHRGRANPPWPPGPLPAWMAELKPKKWRSRYSEHLMPGT